VVSWVRVPEGGEHFAHYPELGIEEWHKKHGCYYDGNEEETKEPETKRQRKAPFKNGEGQV
jgi:hypothetical protein